MPFLSGDLIYTPCASNPCNQVFKIILHDKSEQKTMPTINIMASTTMHTATAEASKKDTSNRTKSRIDQQSNISGKDLCRDPFSVTGEERLIESRDSERQFSSLCS